MPQSTFAESKQITVQDIKELGAASFPCVTIFLPVDVPGRGKRALSARLKAAAAKAEEKLGERSVVSTLVRKVIDPVTAIADTVETEAHGETLVIFSSEQFSRHYFVADKLEETVVAADNFFIRPFLEKIDGERKFYILALSQKDIRLLRCDEHSSEEVDLGNHIPHSLHEDMATDQPDHTLGNRSAPGPSSGNSKGAMFGTGTDKEDRDEYLLHFYKDVSKGISELLKGHEKNPLVLCGVEYELALYKTVDTWPKTCPDGVKGAPNGLKGGEMHARALECLDKMRAAELEEILAHHNRQGGDAAAAGVNEIVKAAYEGRVLHLLCAVNGKAMGNFDEASHRARTHQTPRSGDECLINAAAVQTILHGGRVHAMQQARVPGNRPMAAIMRY
jgi:hypothetical protein